MKVSIDNRMLEEMVEDVLLEHYFGSSDPILEDEDRVDELIGNPFSTTPIPKSKRLDRLRRKRGAGLSPLPGQVEKDVEDSRPGFFGKIAQKLGLSKDFEKMVDKIPPNDKEKLMNAFAASPPDVDGLKDGTWVPKIGDVYAYKPKSGLSQGYAVIDHIGIGDPQKGKSGKQAGLLLKLRVLSSKRSAKSNLKGQSDAGALTSARFNSAYHFFTPEKLKTTLHGKFASEDVAKAAVMTQITQSLEEAKRRVMETLKRSL